LVENHPDIDNYKLYFAQSLYKAGDYEAALTACLSITHEEHAEWSNKLQAAIKFQLDDLAGAKIILEQKLRQDDVTTIMNRGLHWLHCVTYFRNSFLLLEWKIRGSIEMFSGRIATWWILW
jgi:uncharacterized HAD superfamily protein